MDFFNLISKKKQAKRLGEIMKIISRYSMADWLKQIPFQTIRNMLASPETQLIKDMPCLCACDSH